MNITPCQKGSNPGGDRSLKEWKKWNKGEKSSLKEGDFQVGRDSA